MYTLICIGLVLAVFLVMFLFNVIRKTRIFRVGFRVFVVYCAVVALFFGLSLFSNFYTYHRLTAEEPVATLEFTQVGPQQFEVNMSSPEFGQQSYLLQGDDWQLDARILKSKNLARLVGFKNYYRLERINGRYSDIEEQRHHLQTVFSLSPNPGLDLWQMFHKVNARFPWFDALYGNATYQPMADGAIYQVTFSNTGLLARPINTAAIDANQRW